MELRVSIRGGLGGHLPPGELEVQLDGVPLRPGAGWPVTGLPEFRAEAADTGDGVYYNAGERFQNRNWLPERDIARNRKASVRTATGKLLIRDMVR